MREVGRRSFPPVRDQLNVRSEHGLQHAWRLADRQRLIERHSIGRHRPYVPALSLASSTSSATRGTPSAVQLARNASTSDDLRSSKR